MRMVSDLVKEIEGRQQHTAAKPAAQPAHAGSASSKKEGRVRQKVISHDMVASTESELAYRASLGQAPSTPNLLTPVATMPDLWAGRSQVQKICAGLYITNFTGSQNLSLLQKQGITHVVVCANELPIRFPGEFSYLHLDGLTDNTTTSLQPHIAHSLPWIEHAVLAEGRVLVHCAAGCSRSGAIAIAYIMWSQRLSLDAAQALAQRARPIIAPNPGFMEQLRSFEASDCSLRATIDKAE
jgi:hypothetical protein